MTECLPIRLDCCDEELRPVGVLSSVGHGEGELPVLHIEILVGESLAVNAEKNSGLSRKRNHPIIKMYIQYTVYKSNVTI